jgi:hypothetical protein
MYRALSKRIQNNTGKYYYNECSCCNEYKIVFEENSKLICEKCNKSKKKSYNGFYCNSCNKYGIMHMDEDYKGENLVLICDKCEKSREK